MWGQGGCAAKSLNPAGSWSRRWESLQLAWNCCRKDPGPCSLHWNAAARGKTHGQHWQGAAVCFCLDNTFPLHRFLKYLVSISPGLGTQVWAVPAAQREITGCIQGMLKQLGAGSFEGPASIAGPNSTAHSSALRHFGQTPWEGAGNTPPCHLVCSLCIQSMAVPMQQGCGTKLQLLHVQVIRAA